MLPEINSREHAIWPGSKHTQALDGLGVYPRPVHDPLPIWMAVGGSAKSAAGAASLGLPAAFALILGGEWARPAPLLPLYYKTGRERSLDDIMPAILNAGFDPDGRLSERAIASLSSPTKEQIRALEREFL